jgi:flavin-dependent dehydrogenase
VSEQFDVIVIGGGPAGSTAAGFLNQMGHRVLLLEREVFPRHHIGESMIAATIDVLAEIGLEEKLAEANFPVKSGGCFIWGQTTDPWCIRFEEIPGRPTSYQVKRSVFDKLLLDHVAESGVDVRQGHRVLDVVNEDGRVVGVRFSDQDGVQHTATARYTVDASGLAAVVANRLSSRVPVEELKNMCLYGYWTGAHPAPAKLGGQIQPHDRNNIIIKMLSDGWLWFIPLGDPGPGGSAEPDAGQREISVGFVAPRANLPESGGKAALEEFYLERVRSADEWQYLLQDASYTGRFHTVKDWSYRSDRMAGPGYFAVGDASCFVDPILSSGVFLAVLYAKMCAAGVHTILTTSAPEDLVHDWYQGLYLDTYSDYLEMARYWYHGHREVGMWMNRAQEQLEEEEDTVFADTNRDAFIALATGNTHAHPNYVLARQLDSFPLPLHLRKDPRSFYFRETKTALIGHADKEMHPEDAEEIDKSAETLALPGDVRKGMLNMMYTYDQTTLERFSGNGQKASITDAELAMSPRARLSLEAIDDAVTLVIKAPNGQRRAIAWDVETPIVAAFDKPKRPEDVAASTGLDADRVAAFCEELAGAGVLVPADATEPAPERT